MLYRKDIKRLIHNQTEYKNFVELCKEEVRWEEHEQGKRNFPCDYVDPRKVTDKMNTTISLFLLFIREDDYEMSNNWFTTYQKFHKWLDEFKKSLVS